jgi:BMFP domain-containing protein YqiC
MIVEFKIKNNLKQDIKNQVKKLDLVKRSTKSNMLIG